MPPALPHDVSSFFLPPKEKNRCVGISKAPADCVCDVYCSHAVEDLHYIMFLLLTQDPAFPPVHYFCLCVPFPVDVTAITTACFFFSSKASLMRIIAILIWLVIINFGVNVPTVRVKSFHCFLFLAHSHASKKPTADFERLIFDSFQVCKPETWWKLHAQYWCAGVHLISQHRFRSWALTDAPIVPP